MYMRLLLEFSIEQLYITDDSTPIDAPPSHFNSPVTPIAPKPSVELKRSTRARRTPRYLEDFVK